MSVRGVVSESRLASVALGATLILAFLALLLPDWRSPIVVIGSIAPVVMTVAGTLIYRPRGLTWWLISLMLAAWGLAAVHAEVVGRLTPSATALVWAGQGVAAALIVHVGRSRRGQPPSPGGRLDLLIIATVLALVGAQLVAVALLGDSELSGVAVASVDVALLGVLVRFMVTREFLRPSSWMLLTSSVLVIAYDLLNALHGRRLALPGEPAQALGILSVLLLGVAALHPSMAVAFAAETFARRRRPSGALLGLLPLVLVPAALWWVAQRTHTTGLPGWTVPVAGAAIATLCLLRAAAALRSSEHLAEHDPLTDLANRRGLARAYELPAEAAERAVLLIDVDEFKQVNDTHGHDVGDALLLQIRDSLLLAAGPLGVVARLGGDEFVVLTTAQAAREIAQRVLRALEEPFVTDGVVLHVGASIGIAGERSGTGDEGVVSGDPVAPLSTLTELLTYADVAMYRAKAAGGRCAIGYQPNMRLEVARRYTLSTEVRQLLAGHDAGVGFLEVHYQPLVALDSGRVIGAEALVRWRHPERGLLSPDAFLDAVHDNDLDARLDAAVLLAVVDQLARWQHQGRRRLPVSVNLTAASLEDPLLAVRVLDTLAKAGVPASALHLEITEHEPLAHDSVTVASLAELDTAGVEIHLDDYGTGYTSLDYLRRFPVHVLKLDRSVVNEVTRGDDNIVAAVRAMAGALNLLVLAEGVETAQQREHLTALGVQFGQGYLFSRPLPADDFAEKILGAADDGPDAEPLAPDALGSSRS
ncbi:MAG: putative bifunctional diguanylate cyclase/phosphodiesterase [Janthinobacterium lividum]